MKDFFELVEKMREAQRSYFRSRKQAPHMATQLLDQARELERQVDEAIQSKKAKRHGLQKELF